MGWNSWNFFAEQGDDKDIRAAADQMVATGMKDAGYIYVNIDDTWEGERDASGVLHTNAKFPDMKALADYVHSKGLKIGIYSVARAQDLRRLRGLAGPRGAGRARCTPPGASTTSSTTCAASSPTVMRSRLPTTRPNRCGS